MKMAAKYKNQKSPGHSSIFTNTSQSLFGNTFNFSGPACYLLHLLPVKASQL